VKRPNVAVKFIAEPQTEIGALQLSADEADRTRERGGAPCARPCGPQPTLHLRHLHSSGLPNQFAHARAARSPKPRHAPTIRCPLGGVGLGKTHLMHAIGQYVPATRSQVKLTYISSERFMNEMINGLRVRSNPRFS